MFRLFIQQNFRLLGSHPGFVVQTGLDWAFQPFGVGLSVKFEAAGLRAIQAVSDERMASSTGMSMVWTQLVGTNTV